MITLTTLRAEVAAAHPTEHSEGCNVDFGPKLLFVTSVLKINDGANKMIPCSQV